MSVNNRDMRDRPVRECNDHVSHSRIIHHHAGKLIKLVIQDLLSGLQRHTFYFASGEHTNLDILLRFNNVRIF